MWLKENYEYFSNLDEFLFLIKKKRVMVDLKISIITINYNNKSGLEKTIESVLQQTYDNIEYLVIDGNSTDGSKEVIEKHKHRISYWVSDCLLYTSPSPRDTR